VEDWEISGILFSPSLELQVYTQAHGLHTHKHTQSNIFWLISLHQTLSKKTIPFQGCNKIHASSKTNGHVNLGDSTLSTTSFALQQNEL
jgi:hypothetical protein